jgi:hypothetical protein
MSAASVFEILFAVGAAVAAAALAAAAFQAVGERTLQLAAAGIGVAAVVAWIEFALHLERELGFAAAGLTASTVAAAASVPLLRAVKRSARIEEERMRAEAQLREFVENEARERSEELTRLLARVRADSVSLLTHEERRIAEERRAAMAEREREASGELTQALARTQDQVEQRLASWAQDLERTADALSGRIGQLSQRQRQLMAEAESRMLVDADRLKVEGEEQRAALMRLREEIDRSVHEALSAATTDLESHSLERRRALHELEERLRRREREVAEQIEREQGEALRRIQAGFQDVQRRQVEQLERAVERAATTVSEQAGQQFTVLIRTSREDAARRLSRELERAVNAFAREAESVLAERMAHVGDQGAQRLERRLSEITSGLERHQDDAIKEFETRMTELEGEFRRRLAEFAADVEAERAILEARLQELGRRADELSGLARERISELQALRTR